MNTAAAAAVLGKTPWWIRRQCATGELRASFYGGTWNIDPDAITAYVTAHSNTPQPVATRQRRRRAS